MAISGEPGQGGSRAGKSREGRGEPPSPKGGLAHEGDASKAGDSGHARPQHVTSQEHGFGFREAQGRRFPGNERL